ncbi:hypothetical protein [Streptomyces sp. Ac-502]|uniref:hypothetical protein n=1 Tax=Streptomyces sp. Ac-502 TaxID=3342801 RepID=UPI0038627BAC
MPGDTEPSSIALKSSTVPHTVTRPRTTTTLAARPHPTANPLRLASPRNIAVSGAAYTRDQSMTG